MEKLLRFFEKYIIPRRLYAFGQPVYHYLLSFIGALFYGFPSRKMTVIGITGTKGKTTTCNLAHHILNSSGYKTGLSTTVNFKIGDKEWPNGLKQTMPGRFKLQKLLRQMKKEGCQYAVVETSSEGILQYRHKFIDYDVAVFLNISPEHIERHGSFENYRNEKVKLFKKVSQKNKGIGIYNLDEPDVKHFYEADMGERYGFSANSKEQMANSQKQEFKEIFAASDIELNPDCSKFMVNGQKIETKLLGKFNVYNALAAIAVAASQNIPPEKVKESLKTFSSISGRMEIMYAKAGFAVVIDYAHEPKSLESVYQAVSESKVKSQKSKLICLLGACGGGRDKWKRPEMGKIAAENCDEIILANEDPYDENPAAILEEIEAGFSQLPITNYQLPKKSKWELGKNYWKIINRKEAIQKALSLAKKGDAVVLTGKGGEKWMCVEDNKKVPWDEKEIVEDLLRNTLFF